MEACCFECRRNISLLLPKFQTLRSFIKTYSVVVNSTKLFLFSCKLASPDQSLHTYPRGMQRDIMMANMGLVTVIVPDFSKTQLSSNSGASKPIDLTTN